MSKIPIVTVVQGRFHAFALAKAMVERGSDIKVLTNYPPFIAERFGLPRHVVTGFPLHGLLHKYANRWNLTHKIPLLNRLLHESFSRWSCRHIPQSGPVAVHVFSGVALELLHHLESFKNPILTMLTRGSGHIVDQYHDLSREAARAGTAIEKPSPWMIRREMKEYALASSIITLSSFARNTFLKRGHSSSKVLLLPLGSDVKKFRPAEEVIRERQRRIRSGQKLVVLYTGNVSLQKGIIDLIEVATALHGEFHFRVIGNITADAAVRIHAAKGTLELIPRVPEAALPAIYNDADLYIFPTLHDGFAAVLAQAQAGCLPILATDHCAAPDMIVEGRTGWTVPVRRADLMIEQLRWCQTHREAVALMVEDLWQQPTSRDWSAVAADFARHINHATTRHRAVHGWGI